MKRESASAKGKFANCNCNNFNTLCIDSYLRDLDLDLDLQPNWDSFNCCRLFRNFLIALVGAVYGIVKLTDEVDDNNGVLVSANTGSVMATGKATTCWTCQSCMVETTAQIEMMMAPSGALQMYRWLSNLKYWSCPRLMVDTKYTVWPAFGRFLLSRGQVSSARMAASFRWAPLASST